MITMMEAEKYRTSDLACWHRPAGASRLVSLWDMLRIHAEDFVLLMKSLAQVEQCVQGLGSILAGHDVTLYDKKITEFLDRVEVFIVRVEETCVRLELKLSIPSAKRIREKCKDKYGL